MPQVVGPRPGERIENGAPSRSGRDRSGDRCLFAERSHRIRARGDQPPDPFQTGSGGTVEILFTSAPTERRAHLIGHVAVEAPFAESDKETLEVKESFAERHGETVEDDEKYSNPAEAQDAALALAQHHINIQHNDTLLARTILSWQAY